jgi:AraC-like DNA-binding protein
MRSGVGLKIRDTVPAPEPVERDTRGILDPWLLRQRVRLTRHPPTEPLTGVIDRFWAVQWDLPGGAEHSQQVLTHPGANVSVGPADGHGEEGPLEARLYGVTRSLTRRRLRGRGWTVAAMTTVGGLGALIDGSADVYTDRAVPLGEGLGIDEAVLIRDVVDLADEQARVEALAGALEGACRPERLDAAREVSSVARLAESDRSIQRVGDLAERAGVSERTLQRQFVRFAGVSPAWVLRRYRLLEAAEAVRDGASVDWAGLAVRLGYSDQAHLIRDFRAAVGQTPAAYARAQRPRDGR